MISIVSETLISSSTNVADYIKKMINFPKGEDKLSPPCDSDSRRAARAPGGFTNSSKSLRSTLNPTFIDNHSQLTGNNIYAFVNFCGFVVVDYPFSSMSLLKIET